MLINKNCRIPISLRPLIFQAMNPVKGPIVKVWNFKGLRASGWTDIWDWITGFVIIAHLLYVDIYYNFSKQTFVNFLKKFYYQKSTYLTYLTNIEHNWQTPEKHRTYLTNIGHTWQTEDIPDKDRTYVTKILHTW